MKSRSIFSLVLLVAMAFTLFAAPTHAQFPYGYRGPYVRYYGPYRYPPVRRCYAPMFGIRIGGGGERSERSSGISFQFNGIPEALLQVIKNSNVIISGKKVNGNKGAAGNYSSSEGHHLALPPGTYDVVIQLPNSPITIKDVSVGKDQVIPLALPIYNLTGRLPQTSPGRRTYPGSHIVPIPNTRPMPQ